MNKYLMQLILLLAIRQITHAQQNLDFVQEKVHLIKTRQIEVFDNDFRKIENDKITVFQKDTIVNDEWTRTKYIDNIFNEGFDGVVVVNPIVFDTATSIANTNYWEFKIPLHGDHGYFIKDTVVFLIKKSNKTLKIKDKLPRKYRNLKGTSWKNHEIRINGKAVTALDSCHALYRLDLNGDGTFKQYYGGKKEKKCSTADMAEQIEVGIEEDAKEFFKYSYLLQGHYIKNFEGKWKIEQNRLILVDKKSWKVYSYDIVNFSESELHLRLAGYDYEVVYKK